MAGKSTTETADGPSGAGLQLVIEVRDGSAALQQLALLLASRDVPVVQLIAAPGGMLSAQPVLPYVKLAQEHDAAVLLTDAPELARTVRADGVHLTWSTDIEARAGIAREIVGTRFIVGAEAGNSRHTAMTLGEMGLDYVGFGLTTQGGGSAMSATDRLELVAWWAEIFSVPVVACDASNLDEAADLTDAGADFVALRLPSGLSAADLAQWRTDARHALDPGTSLDPMEETAP
ncbi:MAG: thiamine phosphate synthase [Hyphomicrobiaceae bacterium]|nr:thiamine phosphate synthase [Hyphomicrobiaceae bacterium]